jgi:2C-methyl-D-erythritol 2,4-cyclodiphosphate synthase
LQQKREALQKQSQKLDECRAALEQTRSELLRLHRETLEIRLATEELWVQLSAAAPPAALTRSLGRIRSKLADQYRLAGAEVQSQKAELESIRSQLVAQYQKLEDRRKQFEHWAARQQEELQQQANLLIAREQEIRRQEAQLRDSARRWESERLDYQRQILRLQAQLAGQATAKLAEVELLGAPA